MRGSGINAEGIAHPFDTRTVNGDDVKATGWYIFNLPREKIFSRGNQAALLGGRDTRRRPAEALRGARHTGTHFNEYQGAGRIAHHQIDLAALAAIIAADHGQPARLQVAQRTVFTGFTGGGCDGLRRMHSRFEPSNREKFS